MATYYVHWSDEDHEYVGTVAEYPLLSWLADTTEEALSGVQALVAEIEGPQ